MTAKHLGRLTMLASLCIVSRLALAPFPNIKPISAIFFLLQIYLSLPDSLIIMAITMWGTSLLLGFGPWVIWQVITYTLLLLIWSAIRRLMPKKRAHHPFLMACLAGLLAASYGGIIAVFEHLLYKTAWLPYWINGLWFDALHGLSTFLFYPFLNHIFWRFLSHEKLFD